MSDQQLQICNFCQRTIKLAYYCEDCGTSCCSDCLNEEKIETLTCHDCNSQKINIVKGKKYICEDCGSENVNKLNQVLKSCPRCHSLQIINIYEKKEELEKKFLNLIKNARALIEPFKESSNSLIEYRQQIENARAPPIRCHHYPNMESDLYSLIKLFIYAKDNLLEKLAVLFHHISLNKEYFFDIYSQPNSNVRIIEGIFENLNRSFISINEFIETNNDTINKGLIPLQNNLLFIKKISNFFEMYKKYLNLAEEEKPVYAIHAKLANGLNSQDKYRKNKGILFITNFDLSFIHLFGKFKKKRKNIFKAPVEDLIRLKIKGKIFKKLYIEFSYGRYEFTLPPHSINKVLDYIIIARNFDETVIFDKEMAKKLYNIEIDISEVINFVEEAINSFFSIRCQYTKVKQPIQNTQSNNQPLLGNFPTGVNTSIQRSYPNPVYPQIDPRFNPNPGYNLPSNQNIFNPPPLYQNNFTTINGTPQRIQTPHDLRYYSNDLRSLLPPNYNENEFFLQNFNNPNRIQNYQPQRGSTAYNDLISDMENKNILMRKLEQMQKYGKGSISDYYQINPEPLDELLYDSRYRKDSNIMNNVQGDYHGYAKNHLSDLFNSDYSISGSSRRRQNSKIDKLKKKEMLELEKERYSIEQTLNTLDAKFNDGIISEIDYFRTYKNLQKDLYLIDKKIESLDNEIKESESIRKSHRELDRRRYFS
jgi:ribosomal protein L37AE/L43A